MKIKLCVKGRHTQKKTTKRGEGVKSPEPQKYEQLKV